MVEEDEEDNVGVDKARLSLFAEGAFSKVVVDRIFDVMVRSWIGVFVVFMLCLCDWSTRFNVTRHNQPTIHPSIHQGVPAGEKLAWSDVFTLVYNFIEQSTTKR